MQASIPSNEPYIKINHCSQCGRKVWKGYFKMFPDPVQSMVIKIVCWRCKLFGKKE